MSFSDLYSRLATVLSTHNTLGRIIRSTPREVVTCSQEALPIRRCHVVAGISRECYGECDGDQAAVEGYVR